MSRWGMRRVYRRPVLSVAAIDSYHPGCFPKVPVTHVLTAITMLVMAAAPATQPSTGFMLDYDTPTDPQLQTKLEQIDTALREKFGLTSEHAAVGVLDLRTKRLAMIHPDRIEYAASVPKISILLAYFELHPEAAKSLDPATRHELSLMAKASNNETAAKFSRELGLKQIQDVLNRYGFYDASRGGGIWVGKHYGKNKERLGDPVADHSHAATVRQLLRYFLMLDARKRVV